MVPLQKRVILSYVCGGVRVRERGGFDVRDVAAVMCAYCFCALDSFCLAKRKEKQFDEFNRHLGLRENLSFGH